MKANDSPKILHKSDTVWLITAGGLKQKVKRNSQHWEETANQNSYYENTDNGNQTSAFKSMPIYCISEWFLKMEPSLQ